MKSSVLTMIILLSGLFGYSQGVAIGSENVNSSAMLNVSATLTDGATGAGSHRGLLIPRMTFVQRTTMVASPATSLLVYQTDGQTGFYYNAGTSGSPYWVLLKDDRTNFTEKSNSTISATEIISSQLIVQPASGTTTLPSPAEVPAGKTVYVICTSGTITLSTPALTSIVYPGGTVPTMKAVTLISDGSTNWYAVSYSN